MGPGSYSLPSEAHRAITDAADRGVSGRVLYFDVRTRPVQASAIRELLASRRAAIAANIDDAGPSAH